MNDQNKRILGRVLAVEEARAVRGAEAPDTSIGGGTLTDTRPLRDQAIDDGTLPGDTETTINDDSGTATDTGIELDCSVPGAPRDIAISPIDCP